MPDIIKICISRGRPGNVEHMNELVCPDIWVVHTDSERKDYVAAGANNVINTDFDYLYEQRQFALDLMRTEDSVYASFDDDVFKAGWLGNAEYGFTKCEVPEDLDYIVYHIADMMDSTEAYLGGCYHQDIIRFMNHRVHVRQLVSAGFMVIRPQTPCNWTQDPVLMYRDDQDFSMQHIKTHGLVIRANYMMVAHRWYEGEGGLNESRTPMIEVDSAKALMSKWPGEFKRRPGSNRPGDIIMARTGFRGETRAAAFASSLLNGEQGE